MTAYVKLKDISSVCEVPDIQEIICNKTNGSTTITNFKEFRFYPEHYYVFVGKSILHVQGNRIEYVLFK